jgi:hypothetical protein
MKLFSVASTTSQHQFSLQLHSLTDGSDRTNFVHAFEVFSVLALCLKNVAAVVHKHGLFIITLCSSRNETADTWSCRVTGSSRTKVDIRGFVSSCDIDINSGNCMRCGVKSRKTTSCILSSLHAHIITDLVKEIMEF